MGYTYDYLGPTNWRLFLCEIGIGNHGTIGDFIYTAGVEDDDTRERNLGHYHTEPPTPWLHAPKGISDVFLEGSVLWRNRQREEKKKALEEARRKKREEKQAKERARREKRRAEREALEKGLLAHLPKNSSIYQRLNHEIQRKKNEADRSEK